MSKRLTAEFIGTLWLVLGGCGSAVLAGVVYKWVGGDEPGPAPVTGNR
jgi:aquaporin Z